MDICAEHKEYEDMCCMDTNNHQRRNAEKNGNTARINDDNIQKTTKFCGSYRNRRRIESLCMIGMMNGRRGRDAQGRAIQIP